MAESGEQGRASRQGPGEVRPLPIQSVAIINPLGDFGIGGYTYELAEGLAANGIRVDVYTSESFLLDGAPIPWNHRTHRVLGSFLFKQPAVGTNSVERPKQPVRVEAGPVRQARPRWYIPPRAVEWLLSGEMAWHLRRSGYDLIWTQWPFMNRYGAGFWRVCKRFGLQIAHTVHNVLPHEAHPDDAAKCESVYRQADFLIVHSNSARLSLMASFPKINAKVIVSPHGLYTMFRRAPELRGEVRKRLGIRDGQAALLFFGGVRPYKNIDAVLEALRREGQRDPVLIVAGCEQGYNDLIPGEPLGRTRRKAEDLGVAGRVRLIEGILDLQQTAEIFEAADIVVLPYIESSGSGLLMLAMTFGKFVIATRTGGMDEYLSFYPRHVMIEGSSAASVADGIARGIEKTPTGAEHNEWIRIPELEWPQIARGILEQISP
jgi:glycosyltransferase involved in cell wall biosynthesis